MICKPTHGGARQGAGRPPIHGEPTVAVSLTLPQSWVERIRAYAAEHGVSRSQAAVALLRFR